MNNVRTGLIIVLLVSSVSCGNESQSEKSDSTPVADSIASTFTIESLLTIGSETELRRTYGSENVKFDTMWGAEGFFSMGTILKTEPQSHIEITWSNEQLKTDVVSVTLVSDQDWWTDSLDRGMWKSDKGVRLGMSIEGLQNINGRPFTFSGFGWDYAGSVLDWQKGNLEGKGIAIQLAEGPAAVELTPEESAQILGDVMVQSDNPLVKQFSPRVWSISVAKVQ